MLFRVPPPGRTPHALPSPAARPPVHAACSSESLIPAAHQRTTHALSSPDSRPHAACSPKTRLPAAGARCMLFQVPPSGHTPHALQSPASRPHAACSPESRFSAAHRMLSRVPPPGRRRTPHALPSPTSRAHAAWFFRAPPPGPSPGNRRTPHALPSSSSWPHGARCMLSRVPPPGRTPHDLPSSASRPHAASSSESRLPAASRMLVAAARRNDLGEDGTERLPGKFPPGRSRLESLDRAKAAHTIGPGPHVLLSPASRLHAACSSESRLQAARCMRTCCSRRCGRRQ